MVYNLNMDFKNFKYAGLLRECFDVEKIEFKKLIEIYNDTQTGILEKHHIIPKSYFNIKKERIINVGNIIELSAHNHYLAHYYMWKCCKLELLRKKLAAAFILLSSLNKCDDISKGSLEYEKIKEQALRQLEKKVVCLDTGVIYESITKAANYNSSYRRQISNVISGSQTTAYGQYWELYNSNIDYTEEYCKKRIEEIEYEKEKRIFEGRHKNDLQYICLNTRKIYNNVGEINKDYPSSGVSTNLKRGRNIIAGQCWEIYNPDIDYAEEYCNNKILNIYSKKHSKVIYCLENNKQYFSIRDAAKELNLDPSAISKIFKGRLKSTGGYHFKEIILDQK